MKIITKNYHKSRAKNLNFLIICRLKLLSQGRKAYDKFIDNMFWKISQLQEKYSYHRKKYITLQLGGEGDGV